MKDYEKEAVDEKNREESLAGITKNDPIGATLFVVALALGLVALYKFIATYANVDWDTASKESPAGKIIFLIILSIAYLSSIPWLLQKGFRGLASVMSWIAGLAFASFLFAITPSCNKSSNGLNGQGELPYYRK